MEYIPLLRTCLLISGVLQILYFLRISYKVRKSKHWSTVTGEVLHSELIHFNRDDEDTSKTYRAVVKYKYQVEGKIYFSKKIYYGDWIAINFSSYMKNIVKSYSIGRECIVHYNPQKPQNSVLRAILAPPVYSLLLGGLLFTGIGIYMYLF